MCITEFMKLDRETENNLPEIYKAGTGKLLQQNIKYAQDHDATVQRYGRYPHRNEVLGRISTPEEVEYLKSAETYGQWVELAQTSYSSAFWAKSLFGYLLNLRPSKLRVYLIEVSVLLLNKLRDIPSHSLW